MGQKGNFLVLFKSILSLFNPLIYLFCLELFFFGKEFVGVLLYPIGLLVFSLFHQRLLFGLEVDDFLGRFEIIFVIRSDPLLLLFHFSEMLGFELFDWVDCCIFVFLHVIVPGRVELKDFGLLKGVNWSNFALLLVQQFLFMSFHFFVLNLHDFVVGLFRLEVLSCVFALFSVIFQ